MVGEEEKVVVGGVEGGKVGRWEDEGLTKSRRKILTLS